MANLKRQIKEIIPNFINYKKSLGYKYNNTNKFYKIEELLYKNNIYSLDNKNEIINLLSQNLEIKKYKNEILDLIKFNNILNNNDNYIDPKIFNTNKSKHIPTIIKEEKFIEICNYIDRTSIYEKDNYRYIYPVLYRLLYSTGMRINEALCLKLEDINVEENRITINNSKNNKSRTIIISDSMNEVIKKYLEIVKPNDYLFEYKNKKIKYYSIKKNLIKLRCDLNIFFNFHDFRYTMATTSFLNLINQGYSEKEVLYYLHIYLGHSSINETEYYFYFNNIIKESRTK